MASPTISGLSGFDSSGLVTQLVTVASAPLTAIANKKGLVDSATSSMSTFSTYLTTLKSAAAALSSSSGFSSMAASSSDPSIVASVTGNATASSYSIDVTQLAKEQKSRSDAQTSATTALGKAGDLTFQIGSGAPTTVSVVATDSLTDVVNKINQTGLRVSASLINAGGSYSMQLQGLDTGAANAVTVTEGTGIALGLNKATNQVQAAQDAKLTIDGLPISRPTNSISGAIGGVTLALTNTTTSTATLNVNADSSALQTKISAFVSAWNAVVSSAHSSTGYGTVKATNSVLSGDPAVGGVLNMMNASINGVVAGASASYSSLSSVGLKHNTDGTLAFDTTVFSTAIQNDASAVRKLFVTDTATGATGVMSGLSTKLDATMNDPYGLIKARIASFTAQSKALETSFEKKQTYITSYQTQLKAQFAALDSIMAKYSSEATQISGITTA